MQQEWERPKILTKLLLKKTERSHLLEDQSMDGRIPIRRILKKYGGKLRIGFTWLRMGTGGGDRLKRY
jgi:hypothetical protein